MFFQTYAIGNNTSVMFEYLIDGTLYTVFLKIVEDIPYFAFKKSGSLIKKTPFFLIIKIMLKNMIKSFEVDKLWLIFNIKLGSYTSKPALLHLPPDPYRHSRDHQTTFLNPADHGHYQ